MMRRLLGGAALLALGIAQPSVRAQQDILKPFLPDDEKPVLRAKPVERPTGRPPAERPPAAATPTERPPIERPVVVRPARPAPPSAPSGEPPDDPSRTSPPPETRPSAEKPAPRQPAPAATDEPPDPGGEIRLAPSGTPMSPEQIQMSIADSFFARKMFDMAAPEYEKYIGMYPRGASRAAALFRLGESYRQNGSVNAAKSSFETLLAQFTEGDFVAYAAYRLAELYYAEKNFSGALPMFRRASVRLKQPKLVNSAKFFTARTLEALGQKLEARMIYEELTKNTKENPFVDASRLSLAVLLKSAGRTAEALKHAQALAKQTENEELKAEAVVRSGIWLVELKQPEKAAEELRKALEMPQIGKWKEVAQSGLLQLQFDTGKYKEVVETVTAKDAEFSEEIKPQLLILAAKAQAKLGDADGALDLFDQLQKEFPDSPYTKDAAYERLVALYQAEDEGLISQIDAFLDANPNHPKADQVQLIKAEVLFNKKQDYAAAAPIYEELAKSLTLTGALRGEAAFRFAWCLMQTRDHAGAVKAYTTFIERYPTNKLVPAALAQRGLANLRLKATTAALKDFDQLITRHPKAKERELALQQKALLLGQQNENDKMAETFRLLLKDYPETPAAAAAEANYWIGWVAYEKKDFKSAVEPLNKARELDKDQYFERASVRILLSHYYLENAEGTSQEIETYTSGGGKAPVPEDVLRWLGRSFADAAASTEDAEAAGELLKKAAEHLATLTGREDARPEDFLKLGEIHLLLDAPEQSAAKIETYLERTKDPARRAEGLVKLGYAQIALKDPAAAKKSADEALALQPDGTTNARARILAGEIEMARDRFEDAAKIFESVSVIIDDENLTPEALEKAVEAYEKAGLTAESKRLLNLLQSRYPEYWQKKQRGR